MKKQNPSIKNPMISRTQNDGLHIILEGIDGSGKSTALSACQQWAEKRGTRFFDVVQYCKEKKHLPSLDEIGNVTGLLLAEPTFCWTGSAIREEMISKSTANRYTGTETAEAFALDRLVQLRRILIPFLKNNPDRIVIQDRSIISSLAYQPLQEAALTEEKILSFSGNRQALAFAPTDLMILKIPVEIAQDRLAGREEKKDDAVFEKRDFQKRLAKRYEIKTVLGPFQEKGVDISLLDASASREQILNDILQKLSEKYPNFGIMNP